ncbi:MAG: thermonuclease family protein [Zetaproteobacteria bacterium]|nr:thermonuclease family protein [Zetaproteobacteria bacterium]
MLYEYKVKEVIKVVDGDTVDVLIDLGFCTYQMHRVRLTGIDAPETRTKDLEEKARGLGTKKWLEDRLTNVFLHNASELWIKTELDKRGKYGRVLGTLLDYHMGRKCDINREMVNRGLAQQADY